MLNHVYLVEIIFEDDCRVGIVLRVVVCLSSYGNGWPDPLSRHHEDLLLRLPGRQHVLAVALLQQLPDDPLLLSNDLRAIRLLLKPKSIVKCK